MSNKKPGENNNKDQVFAEELVKGLESTTKLIHTLLDDIKGNSELIVTLKSEVNDMNSQLRIMEDIIRGGPSNESLLTRFALLEKDVEYILKELNQRELIGTVEEGNETKAKTEKVKIIVTAIISLISAIIASVATYFSK